MLSPAQRKWRADKIGDLANIAVGSLLFGQFVSEKFHIGFAVRRLFLQRFFFSKPFPNH
jgi:hypothetical protein